MEAAESVTVILHGLVEVRRLNVLLTVPLAFLNDWAISTDGHLLAVHGALHERFALKDLLKFG